MDGTSTCAYRSFIIVPVLVLLHLGTSSWLGHDNLIHLQDSDSCLRSQSDSPLLCVPVVVDAKLGHLLKLPSQHIETLGNSTRVSSYHFGHKLIGVDTAVLSQDTGEHFKCLGKTTETVLVESCQFLAFSFEPDADDLSKSMSTVSKLPAPGTNSGLLMRDLYT